LNTRDIFYFVINTAFNNEAARLMEPHIVVNVLLDYLGHFVDWKNARTLCRQTRDIVKKKLPTFISGARTFIKQNQCMGCWRTIENARWITYKSLPLAMTRYSVVCNHWKCTVGGIMGMIEDVGRQNIRVLKTPFQESSNISIPRSDGSTTEAMCVQHGLINIRGQYCIMTHWSDNFDRCSKNVPWSHYFDFPPEFIFDDWDI